MLPFTREQFYEVFAQYHLATWPAVWLWNLFAIMVAGALIKSQDIRVTRIAMLFLSGLWFWMAGAYHWIAFAPINPAARGFAILFAAQGILFLSKALRLGPAVTTKKRHYQKTAYFLFAYAFVIYPLLGVLAGHTFPAAPIFGLPCPSTIFTFAVLLLTLGTQPGMRHLFEIPIIWSFIGTVAAIQLGVYQDWMMLLAALISMVCLFQVSKKQRTLRTASSLGG